MRWISIFAISIFISISFVSAKEYDPDFEYEIVVKAEGSLGLELEKDPEDQQYLRVSKIHKGGYIDQSKYVDVADRLISLNDKPILNMSMNSFVDMYIEEEFPKTLKFLPIEPWNRKDPEAMKQHYAPPPPKLVNEGVAYLNIQGPFVFENSYQLQQGEIGKLEYDRDVDIEFVAINTLGCDPVANDTYKNKYVILWRGDCNFFEKATIIQNGGGIGMIVVDNSIEKVIPRIKGVDDERFVFHIPFFMTDWFNGHTLMQAGVVSGGLTGQISFARKEVKVEEEVAASDSGANTGKAAKSGKKRYNRKALLNKGAVDITVVGENGYNKVISSKKALYGPKPCGPGYMLVPAGNMCKGFTADIRGSWAITDTTQCSYEEKTRNGQKGGARGVIVVSDDENVIQLPAVNADGIEIPTLMISKSDGEELIQQFTSGNTIFGRMKSIS